MRRALQRALHDERGAIMVLGLFMAVFAAGCLYYVVGIGDAIWQRERMQDAADAAAFSAAVLHARGMNLIALVNMTMAALLAVLIALKLVELVAYGIIATAIGMAFSTAGGSLVVVAPVTQLAQQVRQAHETAKSGIHPALRALRIASKGVRVAIPWIAQARAVQMVMSHYDPPAIVGLAVPSRITLPTRDGTFEDLCDKAGEYVAELIALPFQPLQLGGVVTTVSDPLLDTGSSWFCGTDENAEPPSIETSADVERPLLPSGEACAAYGQDDSAYDASEHERLCAEAQAESERAKAAIDPDTGGCAGVECNMNGLFELQATRALRDCAPRHNDDVFSNFLWQEYRFTRVYVRSRGQWRVETDVVAGSESYALRTKTRRPCGGRAAIVADAWNDHRRRDGLLVPVCEIGEPPSERAREGETRTVDFVQALQVLGCVEKVTTRRELDAEGQGELAPTDGSGDEMAPQLMEEDLQLGANDFQMRAAVIGALPASSVEQIVSTIHREAPNANAGWRSARQLGRVSVAQAEYFYDVENPASPDPASWLWNMRWKARLRRFRWPTPEEESRASASESDRASIADFAVGEVEPTLEDACNAVAEESVCKMLDTSFSNLLVH